jgi:hypothetical protein
MSVPATTKAVADGKLVGPAVTGAALLLKATSVAGPPTAVGGWIAKSTGVTVNTALVR